MKIKISGINEVAGLMNHVTHIVSLVDKKGGRKQLPHCAFNNPNWLITIMDDLEHEDSGEFWHAPDIDDLMNILAYTEGLGDDDVLLVHCHAGICRSTAVAFLVLIQHGTGMKEAMDLIIAQRPRAWPNIRVVLLGDRVLGLAGKATHFMHSWRGSNLMAVDFDDI